MKLNAPLFVTSPYATGFFCRNKWTASIFIPASSPEGNTAAGEGAWHVFRLSGNGVMALNTGELKQKGGGWGERERGGAVVHRENFHLIN